MLITFVRRPVKRGLLVLMPILIPMPVLLVPVFHSTFLLLYQNGLLLPVILLVEVDVVGLALGDLVEMHGVQKPALEESTCHRRLLQCQSLLQRTPPQRRL